MKLKWLEKWMQNKLIQKGYLIIPPSQYRSDMEDEFWIIWDKVKEYTLTSPERGYALYKGIEYLSKRRIPGDFVECGVYQGGSSLLAALSFRRFQDGSRKYWLYDTFTGMPSPTEEDHIAHTGQALSERNPEGWWQAAEKQVLQIFVENKVPQSMVHLVPGKVEDTLKKEVPKKIALLRLDTDWYSSTKVELDILYKKLVPGGILVIDDYGHFTGAKQAVDEFFRDKPEFLARIDYTGRILVKP